MFLKEEFLGNIFALYKDIFICTYVFTVINK